MSATLVRLFLDACARHASRVAVEEVDLALTYGALEARSRAVAAALADAGVRPGDRVGVRLDRGADACATLLGVLRAGAAYVPCDMSFPAARIEAVWADAEVACVVENEPMPGAGLRSFTPERLQAAGSGRAAPEADIGPESPAYLIFTSGSTGAPKGVVVPHRAAAAFVEGEHAFFDITPEDRIAHGFSLAFDAAVEELWLAWRHGATLVVVPGDTARSPDAMPVFLRERRVTVWSTVPTFLAATDADIPPVRLLIVGGEACSDALVRRFARFGRRMANTYGPTETAVVATAAFLTPDRPVTIGRALPGYVARVVGESGAPVARGEPGELWIGGAGVTSGYWRRPELTAAKFVVAAFAGGAVFYRSGDLVCEEPDGSLRFHGRIDEQVKLRGYRIELGEIENALAALPGVAGASVRVWDDAEGDYLAAYVATSPGVTHDERALRGRLAERLPAYMVPARILFSDALPVGVSGKTDRRRLPRPDATSSAEPDAGADLTPTERLVRELWRESLSGVSPAKETDFFEAGGHSLTAAKLVSRLRRMPAFAAVSVADVYAEPRLAGFAAKLDALAATAPRAAAPPPPRDGRIARRHFLCGVAQFLSLYPLLLIASPAWLFAWAMYHIYIARESDDQVAVLTLAGAAAILGFAPIRMAFAVATKWLLLGRVKPGRYRLWGFWYWRFWFVNRVFAFASSGGMRGTPWLNFYLRSLGANVAPDAHIETNFIGVPDLLVIGPGASVGHDAALPGYTVVGGEILVGRIVVGRDACIGAKCLLSHDTELGEGAELADGTLLTPGRRVPPGEILEGAPAKRTGTVDPKTASAPTRCPTGLLLAFAAAHPVLALIPAVAAMPGAWLLAYVDAGYCDFYEGYADVWKLAAAAIPAAVLYVATLALLVAGAKWLLLGRVRAGAYPLRSWKRLRHWFVEALMSLSLETLFPFFATVYTPSWLRLLGAKIGAWTEVSTAENMNPDLLRLGSGVFVADAVCLGASRVRRGVVTLDTVEVGDNTFLGNNGVAPGGVRLGPDGLVGVLSKAPSCPEARECGRSWLGLPAFELPRRQQSADFGERLTRRPTTGLFLGRAFVEFWRIVLPGALTGFTAFVLFLFADDLVSDERVGYAGLVLLFPLLLFILGVVLAGFAIVVKWLVAGRFRPCEHPLWSHGVWRAEFVAAMHEHVAVPALAGMLLGTPFAPWYYRMLGARFGRRVYCETVYMTEFDLVRVDDGAALNMGCDLQTHLFEDRVMKMSRLRIGRDASVGAFAVVLYDAEVGDAARVAGQSLVMKGETAVAGGLWAGVPARRTEDA